MGEIMYTISNANLTISILDPIADQKRLGSRYCTGGYIWQVTDSVKGNLLSGPEYPREPNTFDGQGMPDMFHQALLPESLPMGGEACCIGVGRVRRTSPNEPFDVRFNPEVTNFVKWSVTTSPDMISMNTNDTFQDWAYYLNRSITLDSRSIYSVTQIRNEGKKPLPVRWFAHPFFPIPHDGILCQFSIDMSMPENPGYDMNSEGFVIRKPDHDWNHGWYQVMEYKKTGNELTVIQKHSAIGHVIVKTDFMPGFLPIWGNANTFSFEPYYIRELATGEEACWRIDYIF